MAFNFIKPKEVEEAERVKAQDEQNLRDFEVYTPQQYQQSQGLKDMWGKISNWQIPTWNSEDSTWWGKLTNTMSDIENRKPFTYDLNGDMLYQQYKNQYTRLGDLAMRDTMGQAAALTGGYGNSYAQTVGQQTYQGYLQQLNDKIPELYQLALDKYNREGDELYNRLSAYGNLYNTEYGEHRDAVADSKDERANLVNLYGIKSDEEYGHWYDGEQMKMTASQQELDQLSTILGISTEDAARLYDQAYQSQFDTYNAGVDERNFAYQKERDAIADQLARDQLNEQIRANKASEAAAWARINANETKNGDITPIVNGLKSAQEKGDAALYKYITNDLSGYGVESVFAALDKAGIPRDFLDTYETELRVAQRLNGEVAGGDVGESKHTDNWYEDLLKKYKKVQ